MSNSNRFLVSYIIDNQPQSSEIESEADTLSPEQALEMIRAQNPSMASGNITDVQVQPTQQRNEEDTSPGHNIQHADL